ncbi:hypothetical protein BDZ88DRAFT_423647 [Geranomyces variabilis]|nr:hypothetical protein BDZ88DRAFT_423647 [Geranomyces variabilis]
MSEDIIYVLGLENDCYYVGKSKTPKDRIQQHFSGNGSAWTRLHRPVCVVETQAATTENSEDSLTQRYISKFGIDRVRGGWFHMPNPSKAEVKVMDRMIRSVTGDCFLCGGPGHFAAQCPGSSRSATDALERSCQHRTDTGCRRCGREGHFAACCYARTGIDGASLSDGSTDTCSDSESENSACLDTESEDSACWRCGRDGHYRATCYARRHRNGNRLA